MKSTRILVFYSLFIAMAIAGCVDQPLVDTDDGIRANSHRPGQNTPAHASDPVRLTFYKSLTGPQTIDGEDYLVWNGRVEGDVEGDLETRGQILRESGAIWHVVFYWIIDTDDPDQSFTALLTGTLNNNTGRVVMNGNVVEGWLDGARVHEEGQAAEPRDADDVLPFEGLIRVFPATVR